MKVVALVLAFAAGCVIVPEHRTTTTVLATQRQAPVPGPVGPAGLRIDLSGRTVLVTAARPRTCVELELGTVEIHDYVDGVMKSVDLGNMTSGGRLEDTIAMLAVVGMAEAVTGAVSGLFTGVALIADHGGSTKREQRVIDRVAAACPVPVPDMAIEVTFPSGEVARGTTNAGGVVSVPIPDAAGDGTIVARADGIHAAVRYGRPAPTTIVRLDPPTEAEQRTQRELVGYSAVRDALRACGELHHVTGIVNAQLAIDATGHVTADPDLGGDAFAACVRGGLVAVRFPAGHAMKLVFPYRI